MAYTLLRTTEAGVVLWDYHAVRLKATGEHVVRRNFVRFATDCSPGVWALWSDGAGAIRAERRSGSRLQDDIPVRVAPSPVIDRRGAFDKPSSPGPYDCVRLNGTATLLTSADGAEIYEACSAAVVAWDGKAIVCVPRERPRVWSTAENAIRDNLPVREAPIATVSEALLLVNAVKGSCTLADPHSRRFPVDVRRAIDALFARLTKRPDR
jgi:hypothetical protein